MDMFKFVAPEFIFGSNSIQYTGQTLKNLGADHIFIVTDKTVKLLHWFERIIESIVNEKIKYSIYDNVTENPKDIECEQGKIEYLLHQCDVILAIGGGSVMDCAKGIAILVKNPSPILLYEGIDEIHLPIAPLVCIPTTSGSAAEISQFAIITNTEECYKMAIVSKMIVPDFAIIDPETTLTKEFDLTINTGLDVLAHAIESYMSNAASPITKLHALASIELVVKHLELCSKDLLNLEHREAIMLASVHAGLSFSNASLGLVHAMAHALGARYNLTHGQLNGQLLTGVVTYNLIDNPINVDQIIKLFQDELLLSITNLPDLLDTFILRIRKNDNLPNVIFESAEIDDLMMYILNDPCNATNPKDVTSEGVRWLYEFIRERQT
ncbi:MULTISPECIES: iron-containing alcohol dehydrogenase [unclassified Fusibacter]|uniref:iron-containing alcohol dehydrogenase n=1 Tax=unclassified Fusibacter TaxID=2624464 RepID=UPI0010102E7F|nr:MULTISPECIES: iron-containing alcohol dehydrogenase [unclassified Fusibacter]MCK8060260.1 iron-containing alcohol dehydrogenase [Fusibacter sp. A2]NPE20451.1 iron-containing alcohol dehydrogenase [Fusibacter sp. A1]RXV63656.1 iron-containing alcohol dehydrogenase [Fusibacter sp. A1]